MNNPDWKLGNKLSLKLSVSKNQMFSIEGVIEFIQESNYGIFIHGSVPSIEPISKTNGTFSASYHEGIVSLQVHYTGHKRFESLFRLGEKDMILETVNMTEKYYTKEFIRKTEDLEDTEWKPKKTMEEEEEKEEEKSYVMTERRLSEFPQLRILILYTKQAVNSCPGESCLLSQIQLGVGNFNVALRNSKINISVDFVAERIQEYNDYVEHADMGVILGQMGSVISTSRRNILRCHAVHLTLANSQYCGVGNYALNGRTKGYSVTHYGCIGGYMSLAHEVGHNLGLGHDLSNGGTSPNCGSCWDDNKEIRNCHRSILAYATCITPKGKSLCDRVPFFSNPNVFDMENPISTLRCNNAQVMLNNLDGFMNQFVGNFQPLSNPSMVPTSGPSMVPTNEPSYIPTTNRPVHPSFDPILLMPITRRPVRSSRPSSANPTTCHPLNVMVPTTMHSSSNETIILYDYSSNVIVLSSVLVIFFCIVPLLYCIQSFRKWRPKRVLKTKSHDRKNLEAEALESSQMDPYQDEALKEQHFYQIQERYRVFSQCDLWMEKFDTSRR